MSYQDFVKPYQDGYVDGESGDTPVTAAILNTNYDGFLLALNSWAADIETGLSQKADSSSVGQAISSISGQLVNMQSAINSKSTVSLSTLISTGTKIATMTINGVTYDIYAPSGGSGGSSVAWNQIQLTGTKIAEVTIDGVTTDIYAPSGTAGDTVSWVQTVVSGTKIGTITINGVDTDVYAPTPIDVEANPSGSATAGDLIKLKVGSDIFNVPSGGGSGGHTILDNSGTSMTQRTNLQFKGAYVKDDSTNSKTEVDILRHTTSAEFDQMTTDEKQGILVLDDEYDFDGLYMVNGVFIDTDNVIVQETEFTTSASYTATQDCIVQYRLIGIANSGCESNIDGVTYAHHISDYGHAMYTECAYLKKGQTITFDSRSYSTWASWYRVFGIQTSDDVPDPNYHVYSTDEKVVGEWIDGSTLYEKTFDLGTDLLVSTSSWTTLGITLDADKIIETKTTSTSGSFQGNILIYNDNGTWKGQTPRNGNDSSYVHYLTITYTKS